MKTDQANPGWIDWKACWLSLIEDHVQFREEHKQLLTAQVVLTDRLDRFIKETAEAGKHTDERLNALITIVDGIVRKRPDLAN